MLLTHSCGGARDENRTGPRLPGRSYMISKPVHIRALQPAPIPNALKNRLIQHLEYSKLRSFLRRQPAKKIDKRRRRVNARDCCHDLSFRRSPRLYS